VTTVRNACSPASVVEPDSHLVTAAARSAALSVVVADGRCSDAAETCDRRQT
jgi:hypothetical protein